MNIIKSSKLFFILVSVCILSCQNNIKGNSKHEKSQTIDNLQIIEGACGKIILEDDSHSNLDEAVKAIEEKNKNVLPKGYIIDKKLFKIDYQKDDREFYGIGFPNSQGIYEAISLSNVVDTKGNIYWIDWCKD